MSLTLGGGDAADAAMVLHALRRAAGAPLAAGSEAVPTASWLTASVVYTIER
jgi:hypothetical protein